MPSRSGREALFELAAKILRDHNSEDFALLAPSQDKTDYEKRLSRGGGQKKGGKAPLDYSGIEAFVDLQLQMKKPATDRDDQVVYRSVIFIKSLLRM